MHCVLQNAMCSPDIVNPLQVVQYILYESDSVEVSYADGTCIQVSPCGTTFVCQRPLHMDSLHPINGTIIAIVARVRTDLGTDSEPHPVQCRLNRYRSIFLDRHWSNSTSN